MGLDWITFTVPSAMSKSGIHAMTQSLATEWGKTGIRINAIAPIHFQLKELGQDFLQAKTLVKHLLIQAEAIVKIQWEELARWRN